MSIFNRRPFNVRTVPFNLELAKDGHPIAIGHNVDATLLTTNGGGTHPIVIMVEHPGSEADLYRANHEGEVRGQRFKLFLLKRTVTQYLELVKVGQRILPASVLHLHDSPDTINAARCNGHYAIVAVEVPVPWEAVEVTNNVSQGSTSSDVDDREESEHEDA